MTFLPKVSKFFEVKIHDKNPTNPNGKNINYS
jgi:hypothetical protein